MNTVHLHPVEDVALQPLLALLREEGLPHEDVREGPGEFFLAVGPDGQTLGGGGFERYGDSVLLRSVVTVPERRGRGYGRVLVEGLLEEAHEAGAREAWLLTTTAAPFFADLGFEVMARDSAPETVRESHEFAQACPDSATCMRRSLLTVEE